VWGPPVGDSGTLGRVAGAAEHRAVADVEWRAACGERGDVVDGQVSGGVGGAPVARAPVAVLATPGAEHAGAEPLPGPRAVQGVVPAAVGLPCVVGAAATRAAGDDTADRAELHGASRMRAGPCLTLVTLACTPFDIATSVSRCRAAVYSPTVLVPRDQPQTRSEFARDPVCVSFVDKDPGGGRVAAHQAVTDGRQARPSQSEDSPPGSPGMVAARRPAERTNTPARSASGAGKLIVPSTRGPTTSNLPTRGERTTRKA